MKKEPIQQTAITALQECLVKIPFLQIDRIESPKAKSGIDIQVEVRVQGQTHLLLAQVKNNGQPRIARLAVYELKDRLDGKTNAYGIFIAPYISPMRGKSVKTPASATWTWPGTACCLLRRSTFAKPAPLIPKCKNAICARSTPQNPSVFCAMLTEPQRAWKIAGLAQAVDVSLGQVANVKKLLADRE